MGESESSPQEFVEVRFALSDPAYPFVEITREANCRVELEKMLPRGSNSFAEFFSITGTDPDRVLERAREHDLVDPRLLASYENGGLFEFVVSGFCPAQELAKRGAIPRDVIGENGEGRIIAEVPAAEDASEIIDGFLADHPSATLVAKRSKDHATPLFTTEELQHAVDDRLTDRQQEVLSEAYEAGYYERPSETTGEQIADDLGISAATFSQHLTVAERKLVSLLVGENIVSSRSEG